MRASNPESIFNPYQWLPSYGESDVSFYSSGLDIVVEIKYDKESEYVGGAVILKRNLILKGVRGFIKEPFPGNFLFDGLEINEVGHFIVFKQSDFLENYESNYLRLYGENFPKLKHFYIQFLSENMVLHALARDFFLSDEVFC